MRALLPAELLRVWERGASEPPARRALILLEAAGGETQTHTRLVVGHRDELLLTLREKTFGSRLDTLIACPQCGEQLETELDISALRIAPQPAAMEEIVLSEARHKVRFRPITSADLACLSPGDDIAANQLRLLKRCVLSATCKGREISPSELPSELIDLLAEKMAQADPQADLRLAFNCPACGHAWRGLFDIVSFFWAEINACALRLLREVHILASAYGWGEQQILRLSPQRRKSYLELIVT